MKFFNPGCSPRGFSFLPHALRSRHHHRRTIGHRLTPRPKPQEYPPPAAAILTRNGPVSAKWLHRRWPTFFTPAPRVAPPTKVAKGDYPYGIPVPGKTASRGEPRIRPANTSMWKGFPPGTEVKDPYTDKIFLVP